MAQVEYELGAAVLLSPMIGALGVATNIPAAIAAVPGIYLILNQNANPQNRYLGISDNLQNRFRGTPGRLLRIGFPTAVLNNVYAFVGTVRYRATPLFGGWGGGGWTVHGNYLNPNVFLDFNPYDLEHLFIKSTQHCWPFHTVSNTRKVLPFQNNGGVNIDVRISWNNGGSFNNGAGPNGNPISVAPGNQLL